MAHGVYYISGAELVLEMQYPFFQELFGGYRKDKA